MFIPKLQFSKDLSIFEELSNLKSKLQEEMENNIDDYIDIDLYFHFSKEMIK